MKTLRITIGLVFTFSTAVFSQAVQSFAGEVQPQKKELIVQIDNGADVPALVKKIKDRSPGISGLSVKKVLSETKGIYLLAFDNCQPCTSLPDNLKALPGIRSVSWNQPVEFRDSIPDDPYFTRQWDMERIGLPDVWGISTGGQTIQGDEIVVAVLDKGFDISHDELEDNIWVNRGEIAGDGKDNDGNGLIDDIHGWNFRLNSPQYIVESHGTWVAGIIGAKGNNSKGLAGINWNVKLMLLGVKDASEVIEAFDYVLKMRTLYKTSQGQKGAFIVVTNGSFGIDQVRCSVQPAWGAMYDPLGEAGVLSVAATANEDWDVDEVGDIPTSCPSEYLIAVTSTDINDERVSNAAYGKENVDLAAPGKTTITTTLMNQFREDFSGTSSACPHVAGSIALLYSLPCAEMADLALNQPALASQLMRDAILNNVDPIASLQGKTVTGGRLNVYEAMKYLHAWCIGRPEERAAGDFKEVYIEEQGVVRLFPNPARDVLHVDYSNQDFTELHLRVFNVFGQEVIFPPSDVTVAFENQRIDIQVKDWPMGTYFITLADVDRKVVRKFVKI
jgi:subtilisin family serine protease